MVGNTVKHYKVEEVLGKGGMGVVYRAQDLKLQRPVALKVLSSELTADPERRRRFLLEARTAGRLTHPSIAQVYEVDEQDGATFIAMELVEGKTVRQLIQDRELDLLGSIDVAIQVGEGLVKAHEAGIVHRDIKSENVILTKDGRVKILDFGLAKLLDPLEGETPDGDPSDMRTVAETQIGMVMGTVAYMSPEQARGVRVDHRSDIFSTGVMIYEMATGQLPFQGNSPLDTMHAIAFEETRPITALRQNLPADLQRIVTRCLRKRPDDRYPDVGKLVEDLSVLKKDTESGKVRALSAADRFRDKLYSLRDLTPADYAWYVAGAVALAFIIYLFFFSEAELGLIIVLGVFGLLCYRYAKNRPQKLLARFARKASVIPEVYLVFQQDAQVTVLADRATAPLYERVNSLIGTYNKKLFFGQRQSVSIRDQVSSEEIENVLRQPGVLYVRPDLLERRAGIQQPPVSGPQ
jgi:predicted Ser/Thr protein kinase